MKQTALFSLIIAAAFILPLTAHAEGTPDLSSVIAFATSEGRLCFFDQNTGKLYVYDGEGKACLFQGRLTELGKPFEEVQKITSAPARPMGTGTKVMINDKGEKTVILDGPQAAR